MLKAVLKEGSIVPLHPLPANWDEGTILEIENRFESPLDIDLWARAMNELCKDADPVEDDRTLAVIDAHRQKMRQAGSPE
ncbi:MAG: hypothetical protein ACRC8S_02065 [Fimbriiglobus sp.]